jgi:uncharacterized damage-inducible protein DinB
MNAENELRAALMDYLNNPHTHGTLLDAVADFPEKLINEKPPGTPYSFWDQLEHIRIAQWDMLDFMVNSGYKEMEWPKDYWPKTGEKATKKMWDESVKSFQDDEKALKKLVNDPSSDFFSKIPHGSGQTIFREIMQIIDHNSYHIGQFILMRKLAGEWK